MTQDHIIKSYDKELDQLMAKFDRMGQLANQQLKDAGAALDTHDLAAARRVIEADDAVDELETTIGEDVVQLLALRAPMAGDLRRIFAALRIVSDLERIGDCAVNIARRIESVSANLPAAHLTRLDRLCERATRQVGDGLKAWKDNDTALAWKVWHDDAKLDDGYVGLFRELLTYMMEEPRQITTCTHLLFMAKNLERIGDHATNIAEGVWYAVNGTPLTAESPKPES